MEVMESLRRSQNADGGWGYFPGKESWLEPTVYSALALARDRSSGDRALSAWHLISAWQNCDGGFRPSAKVRGSTWCTALAVTLGEALNQSGPVIDRAAAWLLNSAGAESSTLNCFLRRFGVARIEREVKYPGWPWRPGTSAWVEPTVHSLIALRKVAHRNPNRAMSGRIDAGERMLLEVRCADGGWNYGSPRALGIALDSYPETTALALVGLQHRAPDEAWTRVAGTESPSPLASAWFRIAKALRSGGEQQKPEFNQPDTVVAALNQLAANADLLLPGVRR